MGRHASSKPQREMIKFLDLQRVTALYADEYHEAMRRVADSGWYLQGKEVAQFEQDYGEDFLGVSVRVVSDEDFEFEISETMANEFVIKNGILADPVTVM